MKKEKMPEEAKFLLEIIRKAGKKGVTREEMRNTQLGDLFLNPNAFDWLSAKKKIQCHVIIKGSQIINTWFLWKKRRGKEPSPDLKQALGIS